MSTSDLEDEERDSPLPTPTTLPPYLTQQAASMFDSFASFSFGGSGPTSSALPSSSGQPGMNFPDYCLPRRPSNPLWEGGAIREGREYEVEGRKDEEVEVNPSPSYGNLRADRTWIEQASTPTAESPKFDYPLPAGQEQEEEGVAIPTRPQISPNIAERRGSISLPNVPTTSNTIAFSPLTSFQAPPPSRPSSVSRAGVPAPLASPHLRSSSQSSSRSSSSASSSSAHQFSFSPSLLHPHTSPFYSQPPSPAVNFPPRRISLTRSLSSNRPLSPSGSAPPSSSQTHFHPPPTHRFHPSTTPAPIPPSLRGHPALTGGPRRGSLPAIKLSAQLNSPPLGTRVRASEVSDVLVGRRRRGSLAEKSLKERVAEEEEKSRMEGRPRLGSIPSYGSDESSEGSEGKTPT